MAGLPVTASCSISGSTVQVLVIFGEVGQGLHGEGLHDAAAVAEVAEKHVDCLVSAAWRQRHSSEQLRGMPAHLLLLSRGSGGQQRAHVGVEQLRPDARDLLDGICGAHPHNRCVIAHRGEHGIERTWISEHVLDHLVGTADRTPIRRIPQLGDDR